MPKLRRRKETGTRHGLRLVLPEAALATIFDECDRFNQDETGGRVIGTVSEHHGQITLRVSGIIESGPGAQRTQVSFFQDGAHQERVFRQIEESHPEIEHLGNWHTHHVNGLSRLSSGDVETYTRTVNHPNHNLDIFYALLVTGRNRSSDPRRRYRVNHYLFRRGEHRFHELTPSEVAIIDAPLVWPHEEQHHAGRRKPEPAPAEALPDRVYDRDIISEFYQGFRPFASPKVGLYWRGMLELLDGSAVEVVVVENSAGPKPAYTPMLRNPPEVLAGVAEELAQTPFASARGALFTTERVCNRRLYQERGNAERARSRAGG